MKSQKEAVINTILSKYEEQTGSPYILDSEEIMKEILSKESKKEIRETLIKGFESNEIELKSKQEDLGKYVSGLLNNWLEKFPGFNNGKKHSIKNPGTRAGSKDPQVQELRKVKKFLEQNGKDSSEVQEAIKSRLNEIRPEKSKKVVSKDDIDMSQLPAHLQALLG